MPAKRFHHLLLLFSIEINKKAIAFSNTKFDFLVKFATLYGLFSLFPQAIQQRPYFDRIHKIKFSISFGDGELKANSTVKVLYLNTCR